MPPAQPRKDNHPNLPLPEMDGRGPEGADNAPKESAQERTKISSQRIAHLWKTKGPMTESQIAMELGVPLDKTTKPMISNLLTALTNSTRGKGGEQKEKSYGEARQQHATHSERSHHRHGHLDANVKAAMNQLFSQGRRDTPSKALPSSGEPNVHGQDASNIELSRRFSQPTNMSISDSSNGSLTDADKRIEVRPHSSLPSHMSRNNSGADLSVVDTQNSPLSAQAKVQNYLGMMEGKSGPPLPPPGQGTPSRPPPPMGVPQGAQYRHSNYQPSGRPF